MKIWNLFRHQVSNFNTTIILSTHYTYEASISDRIGIIKSGKMMIEASPKTILRNLRKDSLSDAMLDLYTGNHDLIERTECEGIEEEKESVNLRNSSWERFFALVTNDFRLLRRSPL
jgi:ABC-type multidrug transport system ATPase subunit